MLVDELVIRPIIRLSEIVQYKAADHITLEGSGLSDDIFELLLVSNFFRRTSSINMIKVNVGEKSIRSLATLSTLKSIKSYDKNGKLAKHLINLKKQRANIKIDYRTRFA